MLELLIPLQARKRFNKYSEVFPPVYRDIQDFMIAPMITFLSIQLISRIRTNIRSGIL